MPEAGPVARTAHSQAMLVALCSLLLAASVGVWLFAFFPLMGNDYKFWVPLIYEGRMAWWSFGAISYDFSPLRCLGKPTSACDEFSFTVSAAAKYRFAPRGSPARSSAWPSLRFTGS